MILVFGKKGQVARAIKCLEPLTQCVSRTQVNLAVTGRARDHILREQPVAVINAAAYTAVDRAESEPEAAFRLNAAAPGEMAQACRELDIPLVHLSSDYVFDGSGSAPRRPDEPTGPVNVYGQSKLAGEQQVVEAGGRFIILRTSWVFSGTGTNFVKRMLQLSTVRDELTVVADQVGGPTPAIAIAQASLRAAELLRTRPELSGIYHLSGQPDVSWAEFGRTIMQLANRSTRIVDVATREYPNAAKRPLNSRLDCSDTAAKLGIERPEWYPAVQQIIRTEVEICPSAKASTRLMDPALGVSADH